MSIFSFGQRAGGSARNGSASTAARDAWIRAAFEAAPIGLATATVDGHWLNVNETCCHLLGYTFNELIHYSLHDLTHPDDANKELPLIRRVLAGEQRQYRIEKRIIDKSGQYRTLLVSATRIRRNPGESDIFVYVIEPPESPAESGHDAGRLATTILDELTDVAVIRADARGMVTGWNRGAERILGYPRQEIIGKNRRLLYRDQDNWDDRPASHLRGAVDHGHNTCDDFRVAKDGKHVWLRSWITPYKPDGVVRGFVEVLSPRDDSQSMVDIKPMLDQMRKERDVARVATITAEEQIAELKKQAAVRDQELRILADTLRKEIDQRSSFERQLEDSRLAQSVIVAQAPAPVAAAQATLELDVEPPWSELENQKPVDLLLTAAANRHTGALIVANDTHHKAIFFNEGRLVCIASDDPNDFLGERLVRSGVITEVQRTKALQLAQTTDLAFARCLVLLGMMTDEMVEEALRGKTEDDIEVFASWNDCSWSFVDREPPHRKLLQLSLDVYELRAVRNAIGNRSVRPLRVAEPQYIATGNGTRFHLPACTTLRRVADDQRVLLTKPEASARGLTKCGRCLAAEES